MTDFGLQNLDRLVVSVGEGDSDCRDGIVAALQRMGLQHIRAHATMKGLLGSAPEADIIILGDNIDLAPWAALRDLRHNRLAANPFAIVTCVVGMGRRADAQDAIGAGADDVFSRPLNDEQFVQRLRRLIMHRPGFVATSDYVGPDRRARDRGAAIGRVAAPNPVLGKGNGVDSHIEIDAAVRDLVQARLDAHGYRLGFMCRVAAEQPDRAPEIAASLISILNDATISAAALGEMVDALMCGALARLLNSSAATDASQALTRVGRTVVPCLRANTPLVMQSEAVTSGAATYRSRPRAAFPAPFGIRIADSPPPMAFPDVDIREYPKGAALFRQNDPVTFHHIIAAGSVALYRRRQTLQVPVALVRKGEALGESADIGTYRITAIAAEPTVTLLIARADLQTKVETAHPHLARYLTILGASTSMLHDLYTPRSRHVSDSVQQMIEQVAAIRDYVGSPSAPAGLKAEAVAVAERLETLTAEMIAMIADHPELDRRSRVMPAADELGLDQDRPSGER